MRQGFKSYPSGLIHIDAGASRSGQPVGPSDVQEETLADFLAYLAGSEPADQPAAASPACACRACPRPKAGVCRVAIGGSHPSRVAADLPRLADELETALRHTRRRIAQAWRVAV